MMGALVAASPQKSAANQSVATDGKRKKPPVAKLANDDPPEISADEAVALFFGDVVAYWEGDAPQFRRVAYTYSKMAKRSGWPDLSDKKLSKLLSENHGCVSRTTNKRDADGRRLSVVIFPSIEGPPS